ncbi:hypothetical protein [Haloarcula halophila]|nr:hypothetical protein [Halomicroarcula sp. DFY41]
MTSRNRHDADLSPDQPVEVTEFGGLGVAYVPSEDEAWISGWVDVPR